MSKKVVMDIKKWKAEVSRGKNKPDKDLYAVKVCAIDFLSIYNHVVSVIESL